MELDPQVAATKRWRSGYWKKWHESILLTCDDVESDQDRRQVTEEAQLAETRKMRSEDEPYDVDEPEFREISFEHEDRLREERARDRLRDERAAADWEVRQARPMGCCSFEPVDTESEMSAENNVQIARLISALGGSNAGRRAILQAVAERQGIDDPDVIEEMMHGGSDQKVEVPIGLRDAFRSIGLDHVMTPVNLITASAGAQVLTAGDSWEDLEFEVALDSGSVVHVCALADCPGYLLQDSPGSRVGQQFQMGDGGQIPNLGQKSLNLSDEGLGSDVQSVFQIAAVTRPLMSVGKICDEGHEVTFSNVCAVVRNKDGNELCKFHRDSGGLYVAKLRLRNPLGFPRPE